MFNLLLQFTNLIFSTIIENLLTFTEKNITPVMYKYFKENSDPTKNLFIQNSVLNFSEFFVDQTVTKNEVKNNTELDEFDKYRKHPIWA